MRQKTPSPPTLFQAQCCEPAQTEQFQVFWPAVSRSLQVFHWQHLCSGDKVGFSLFPRDSEGWQSTGQAGADPGMAGAGWDRLGSPGDGRVLPWWPWRCPGAALRRSRRPRAAARRARAAAGARQSPWLSGHSEGSVLHTHTHPHTLCWLLQDVPRAAGSVPVSQSEPFGGDAQARATCLALAPASDVAAVGSVWRRGLLVMQLLHLRLKSALNFPIFPL